MKMRSWSHRFAKATWRHWQPCKRDIKACPAVLAITHNVASPSGYRSTAIRSLWLGGREDFCGPGALHCEHSQRWNLLTTFLV